MSFSALGFPEGQLVARLIWHESPYGCGSKRKPLGTTGFNLFVLLPIGFFGYSFLNMFVFKQPKKTKEQTVKSPKKRLNKKTHTKTKKNMVDNHFNTQRTPQRIR